MDIRLPLLIPALAAILALTPLTVHGQEHGHGGHGGHEAATPHVPEGHSGHGPEAAPQPQAAQAPESAAGMTPADHSGHAAPALGAGSPSVDHSGHDRSGDDGPWGMYPGHAWADPSIPLSPPGPFRTGTIVTLPDLPALAYTMERGVKVFRLTAQPVERRILDGAPPPDSVWGRMAAAKGAMHHDQPPLTLRLWGFNGVSPGPLIEAFEGDRVRFVVRNELPEPTSIHWHGLEVPNAMDGVGGLTQPPIMPGETWTYEFTLRQTGTFMYHSSFNEHKQVGMGLGGMLVIHPRKGPRPDREFGLVLQEWAVHPGATVPAVSSTDPNWFTINGKSAPSTSILTVRQGERVRVRMVNLSSLHAHPLHLHGVTWRVTGTEGGPIPASAQWPGNTVSVPPGAARDVDFAPPHSGLWHFHCHILHHVVNGHSEAPMGVMPMGGMATILHVLPHGGRP